MLSLMRFADPRALQVVGLLAVVAGVWTWAQLLGDPPSLAVAAAAPLPAASSLAGQWFDERAAPLDIKVSGLLATQRGAVAILSVNDKPARPFMVGESLAPQVKLVQVEATQITVDRAGERQHIAIRRVLPALQLPTLSAPPR
ncbi:type II secretion system protein N [Pseudomonas huanghezhanensis]|uniref:type II secretion system protein N n=1 Tax=Pseudomonas huanghezhanensis TaxID=3002903 RepID=UPI002285F7BC|nr:type II secretion system protein N [Pseudomonas sp. BSw22131]